MSERDDATPGAPGADSAPEGFEDTVVEILSIGDEEGDEADPAGDGADPSSRARRAARDPQEDGEDAERLEALLAAERERSLRLRADFDNYRKRTDRERGEIERKALVEAMRELLPVVDNLERALSAENAQGEAGDLRKGVEMTLRQFQELLKRYGLSAIPALGERFDPSVHEAVFQEESDSVTTPTVAMELQRGYLLNDRLLRPSLVKVSVPRETADDDSFPDPGK